MPLFQVSSSRRMLWFAVLMSVFVLSTAVVLQPLQEFGDNPLVTTPSSKTVLSSLLSTNKTTILHLVAHTSTPNTTVDLATTDSPSFLTPITYWMIYSLVLTIIVGTLLIRCCCKYLKPKIFNQRGGYRLQPLFYYTSET